MSSGVTPARPKASAPERTQGDTVKSSHSLIVVWERASPVPRTQTGSLAESRARSSAASTTAPPPSERMQHCSLVKGSAIMRELTTSSIVIGYAVVGLGVERGVVAGGDGDLGQLL